MVCWQRTAWRPCLIADARRTEVWQFTGQSWQRDRPWESGLEALRAAWPPNRDGIDCGLRLRDPGIETGVARFCWPTMPFQQTLAWDREVGSWRPARTQLPPDTPIVDHRGRDAGLRFVDLDADGFDDLVFSNPQRFAVYQYHQPTSAWRPARRGTHPSDQHVPPIVRDDGNNGVWFADGFLWVQNEDTHRLPDGIDRRSYQDLLSSGQ